VANQKKPSTPEAIVPTEASSGPKRRVKNPETFRERAIKATVADDKPRRGSKVRSTTAKPFKVTGRGLNKIFNRQPFRFIGKIIVPSYFRNSFKELKLVEWPGWKLSRQLTFAVLAFAVVFGGAIALVDLGLDKVFRNILLK
jgi:preprotein translocase SecE subunit